MLIALPVLAWATQPPSVRAPSPSDLNALVCSCDQRWWTPADLLADRPPDSIELGAGLPELLTRCAVRCGCPPCLASPLPLAAIDHYETADMRAFHRTDILGIFPKADDFYLADPRTFPAKGFGGPLGVDARVMGSDVDWAFGDRDGRLTFEELGRAARAKSLSSVPCDPDLDSLRWAIWGVDGRPRLASKALARVPTLGRRFATDYGDFLVIVHQLRALEGPVAGTLLGCFGVAP